MYFLYRSLSEHGFWVVRGFWNEASAAAVVVPFDGFRRWQANERLYVVWSCVQYCVHKHAQRVLALYNIKYCINPPKLSLRTFSFLSASLPRRKNIHRVNTNFPHYFAKICISAFDSFLIVQSPSISFLIFWLNMFQDFGISRLKDIIKFWVLINGNTYDCNKLFILPNWVYLVSRFSI